LVPDSDQILERLARADVEQLGFSPQQLREEALKAKLILSRPGWRERIVAAEVHGYFNGQIEFLLKFSGVLDRWLSDKSAAWSEAEDAESQRRFSDYFAKSSAVFSANGLINFGECRWERALLLKGDYLLTRGINHCLLNNAERDASWKRLLRGSFKADPAVEAKRQHVQELFDEIELSAGVRASLDTVLKHLLPSEPWRRAMVETPEVIDYCWGRKVRWHDNGNIYLLRKTQMNGEHAELFTFHLKVALLSSKYQNGELAPFGTPEYWSVNGEAEEPRAYLEWLRSGDRIALTIVSYPHGYRLTVAKRGGQLPTDLMELFVNTANFEAQENGTVLRMVDRATIEQAINDTVAAARSSPIPAPNPSQTS
jgi:hypothetical protein